MSTIAIEKIEAAVKAEIETASAAGKPLFGGPGDNLGSSDKARQERTLGKLARLGLTPWDVLSGSEAAKHSGISASWLLKVRAQGDGPPCFPVGDGQVMYPAGELFFWLEGSRPDNAGEQL